MQTTDIMSDTVEKRSSAVLRLARTMESAGWVIDYLDLDLTGERPRCDMSVTRSDGRRVTARMDNIGRCVVETSAVSTELDVSDYGLKSPRSIRISEQFLSRRRFDGPRSMLRMVTTYLSDNSPNIVALADMRSAWAGVMSAPADVKQLA